MIVAGIGCGAGVSAADILSAYRAALAVHGVVAADRLATAQVKRGEGGLREAAAALRLPLDLVPKADLAACAARVPTCSARVEAALGVPSVAEAAALHAAGEGGRLLGPRLASGRVTCALAEGKGSR